MKGIEWINEKIPDLLKENNLSYEWVNNTNGICIHVSQYPYLFQLKCDEQLGWNVYLEMKNEVVLEYPEADELYCEIQRYIEDINFHYYDLDDLILPKMEFEMNLMDDILRPYKDLIKETTRDKVTYSIKCCDIDDKMPSMEIKYSIALDIWTMKIENFFEGNNMNDDLFELYDEVNRHVQSLNKREDLFFF
ncbi:MULTISPECIES: hypothetical protein [Bacillus cereus group]|uniref:hypothetical protein n=1 Tax=Bacillus cereus group TaxID=86661 RepID=UPI001F55D971|nr:MULTISPECIES: hypothetical protein [Bacillus cereus group]